MSNTLNPYAAGSWSNASYWPTSAHPPTYGALPSTPVVASPSTVTFQFNSGPGGTPLSSTVTDTNNTAYFTIYTQIVNGVKVTTFATAADGNPFATVEWLEPRPLVTIRNRVPRQDATNWLSFSRDRSTANLTIGSECYLWSLHGRCIKLYRRSGTTSSEKFGKLYWSSVTNSLCIDLHVSILQVPGNLEAFIVSGALLQSQVEM